MSDDNDTREEILADWCGEEYSEAGRRTLLAELDRADPLRVLLADDAAALEVVAAASWAAYRSTKWTDQPEWYREKWRTLQRSEHVAVLAALREVAD